VPFPPVNRFRNGGCDIILVVVHVDGTRFLHLIETDQVLRLVAIVTYDISSSIMSNFFQSPPLYSIVQRLFSCADELVGG
jgi:hypothetical protein